MHKYHGATVYAKCWPEGRALQTLKIYVWSYVDNGALVTLD